MSYEKSLYSRESTKAKDISNISYTSVHKTEIRILEDSQTVQLYQYKPSNDI